MSGKEHESYGSEEDMGDEGRGGKQIGWSYQEICLLLIKMNGLHQSD